MRAWSNQEIELIIKVYFQMLSHEIQNKKYSKTEFRKNLLPLLNNRSEGSIEYKHQNISAVLANLGQPFLKGYLPRYNYQRELEEKLIEFLKLNRSFESLFEFFADNQQITPANKLNFENIEVDPPVMKNVREPKVSYDFNAIKTNYLQREQNNTKLGYLGEKMVLDFEKWKLVRIGKDKLADEIKWISQEEGDGAGFDILSKNPNGTDKYVEVKTTKLGKETPIFFTRNELLFSTNRSHDYHLFRVFNFKDAAKLFIKRGSLNNICYSVPVSFKGFF